jgi:large-conductance mechanosensitive channel
MDASPKNFVQEFRSTILKRFVGQVALAVVLAEACLHFLNALLWFLILPAISGAMNGHSESVLFQTKPVVPWERLFASVLEFILAIIFVFYAHRWIRGSSSTPSEHPEVDSSQASHSAPEQEAPAYYNIAGERLSPTEQDK